MKKFLLFTFVLNCSIVVAQPTITSTSFNSYSDVGTTYSGSSSTLGVGSAGANQTWNFSSLQLTSDGNYSSTAVATAPYSNEFSNSNFFVKYTDPGFDDVYDIFSISNLKLEVLGSTIDTGVSEVYSNPRTVYVFPFNYTNSFTDSYEILGESLISATITYDAYGTLITQFGTYSNVARIKTQDDGGTFYTWAITNPYRELAFASTGDDGQIYFSIKNISNLDTNSMLSKNSFSISPNPFSSDFNINLNSEVQEVMNINVYDLLGNTIISNQRLEGNTNNVSLPNVARGIYFVKISDNQNNVLFTGKVTKQ